MARLSASTFGPRRRVRATVRLLVVTDRDFQRLLLEQPRLQRSVLNALTTRLAVDTT